MSSLDKYISTTTIKDLQSLYPYLDWLDYINAILPDGLDVAEDEIILVGIPKMILQLGKLLDSTSKRTIANYFLWRIVLSTSGALTERLLDLELQFDKDLKGYLQKGERWKKCVSETADR